MDMNSYEELKDAVKRLLDLREQSEDSYYDAWDFVFKSYGRDAWESLITMTGWTPNGKGE